MSWQVYVDSNLIGTGKVQKAAILGQQGGVWAKSAGYDLPVDEQKAIINAFNDLDKTNASGVRLCGQKFFTIQCNPQSIYGKKGADGCIMVKTKQAILVTEYVAPIQAGEVTTIVEGLGDYLRGVNY